MAQTALELLNSMSGGTWVKPAPTPAMLTDRGDNRTTVLNSNQTQAIGSTGPGSNVVVGNNGQNIGTMNNQTAQFVPNQQNNPAPQNNNESLIQAMMKGGHSRDSAMATIQGRGYDALAREYLGNTGGGFTSSEGNNYGSQEEYNRLIDESYNPQISALNEQEQNLNLGQTSALEQAQAAFNTQQGMAQGQLQTANNQLGEVATKGQSAYESALAQARQVYDQLQRGYNQRFGGASSAGQAATEIGNVERLRQQGSSYKQLQDVNRQVEMGKMDVQKQYDQNILQLEQNKQQAISAVQNDFRDKLAQINASKGMVESAKAGAKLQALQALRAQVLQVQQQETSFKQQLEMQKQQAAIQLDTYAKQLDMSKGNTIGSANTGISNLNQRITPQSTVNGGAMAQTYNPTGQVSPQYRDPRDLISQNIWG